MRFLIYFVITLATIGLGYSFFIIYPWFFGGYCSVSGEECLEFLGIPSCAYTFILFGITLFFGWGMLSRQSKKRTSSMRVLFWVTLFGMLFTLYFSIQELFIKACQGGDCSFSFYYPSCLYCFVIFVLSFGLARYITGNYSHNKAPLSY